MVVAGGVVQWSALKWRHLLGGGLRASYSTPGAPGSPRSREHSSVSGAGSDFVEASARESRYQLLDRALSSPGEGPKFLRAGQGGERNERDQQVDSRERAKVLSPVRPRLRKVQA